MIDCIFSILLTFMPAIFLMLVSEMLVEAFHRSCEDERLD